MKLSLVPALLTLAAAMPLHAQTVVQERTTTTSTGTISEFGPERITVQTESAPLSYRVSKTVTYVDEAGEPVSMEVVKSGLPVTVHYTRSGDVLTANKIVVRKRTATVEPAIRETRTTTTTSSGTVREVTPDLFVVQTSAANPLRYRFTKTTTYVDEAGNPVSLKTVRSGLPVTIHYTKSGDDLIAQKVIVRKVTTTEAVPPAAVETTETTTTTTTTNTGTVSEFGKGQLIIRTEESTMPLMYTANGATPTFDEAGNPISFEMVRSGLPVTVHYITEGDQRIAKKIVVRKTTTVVPR